MTRSLIALTVLLATVAALPTRAQTNPEKIVVSCATAPFNVPTIVARERGLLETAFKPLGVAVQMPEITSGARQVQALAAGAIDIAAVLGGTSAILGRANGVELAVIAAYSRNPKAFMIMAMPGGPRHLEDLKGRSVAGPKGTTLNQLLAAGLASKDLKLDAVRYINMDLPAARAALLAGSVDAATLAGNHALAVQAAGGHVIATGAGLIEPTSVIATRREFIDRHPDLVRRYLEVHEQALAFMRNQPEAALELAAKEQKMPLGDARKMFEWYDFSSAITATDVANLEADQEFMIANGMLTRRIEIRRDLIHPMATTP